MGGIRTRGTERFDQHILTGQSKLGKEATQATIGEVLHHFGGSFGSEIQEERPLRKWFLKTMGLFDGKIIPNEIGNAHVVTLRWR